MLHSSPPPTLSLSLSLSPCHSVLMSTSSGSIPIIHPPSQIIMLHLSPPPLFLSTSNFPALCVATWVGVINLQTLIVLYNFRGSLITNNFIGNCTVIYQVVNLITPRVRLHHSVLYSLIIPAVSPFFETVESSISLTAVLCMIDTLARSPI